jgi:hypothetical protein
VHLYVAPADIDRVLTIVDSMRRCATKRPNVACTWHASYGSSGFAAAFYMFARR